MGIIKKQSLQSSIISFIGTGIGTLSRLSMPFVLSTTQLGLIQLLDTISGTFVTLFNMGYNLILKNLFPKYRNEEKGHDGFLAFGILLSLLGIFAAIGSYYWFEDSILSNQANDTPLIKKYAFLIPVLIFFRIIYLNLDGYVRILYKTVIGTFLESFLTKAMLLIILVLFAVSIYNFDTFIYLYAITLSLPGFIIIWYSQKNTRNFVLPTKSLLSKENKIPSLIMFGVLSGSAGSIINYVDTWMIYKMFPENPEDYVGIYSLMLLASLLILIPSKSLNKISSVILAESWKTNDMDNIKDIYKRSCNNLLLVGGYLFIIGWACIDEALYFLPNYLEGKYVFFFLGLTRVVELATGVNTDIIETSPAYRFNTYLNILLAVLIIALNLVFIPLYGIIGAALATLLVFVVLNALKALVLKVQYNLNPYDSVFFKSLIFFVIFTIVISLVDYDLNPIIKIILNFITITALYSFFVIKLKLSTDLSESFYRVKRRFFN